MTYAPRSVRLQARSAPDRWKTTDRGSGRLISFFEQSSARAGLLFLDPLSLFQHRHPFPHQCFRIAVEVERLPLNLVIATKHYGYHPAGRRLKFEALLSSFETQRLTDPRDMDLRPELKARTCRLLHQFFRELGVFEFFGPGRDCSRAMLIRFAPPVNAGVRFVARLERLQIVFQIVEKAHSPPVSRIRAGGVYRVHTWVLPKRAIPTYPRTLNFRPPSSTVILQR